MRSCDHHSLPQSNQSPVTDKENQPHPLPVNQLSKYDSTLEQPHPSSTTAMKPRPSSIRTERRYYKLVREHLITRNNQCNVSCDAWMLTCEYFNAMQPHPLTTTFDWSEFILHENWIHFTWQLLLSFINVQTSGYPGIVNWRANASTLLFISLILSCNCLSVSSSWLTCLRVPPSVMRSHEPYLTSVKISGDSNIFMLHCTRNIEEGIYNYSLNCPSYYKALSLNICYCRSFCSGKIIFVFHA